MAIFSDSMKRIENFKKAKKSDSAFHIRGATIWTSCTSLGDVSWRITSCRGIALFLWVSGTMHLTDPFDALLRGRLYYDDTQVRFALRPAKTTLRFLFYSFFFLQFFFRFVDSLSVNLRVSDRRKLRARIRAFTRRHRRVALDTFGQMLSAFVYRKRAYWSLSCLYISIE